MQKKRIALLLATAMVMTAPGMSGTAVYAAEEVLTESEITDEAAEDVTQEEPAADDSITEEEFTPDVENLTPEENSGEVVTQEAEPGNAVEDIFSDGNVAAGSATAESVNVVRSGSCGESATYTLYDDGRLVIEGSGAIAGDEFKSKSDIKYVQIGSGITDLGEQTFEYCSKLRSVTIEGNITKIGNGIFHYCERLDSITLPESVTEIGEMAFFSCSSLEEIVLPQKLISIGDQAFEFCSAIKTIEIPESVCDIGESAFSGCSNMTKIKLPANLKEIKAETFEQCSNLREITMPGSVTEIGNGAFNFCGNLKEVTLPDSLTGIGEGAFHCTGITSITLPDKITEIKDYTFSNSSLKDIKFPANLKTIGYGAFNGCDLSNVILPETLTSIDTDAFTREYSMSGTGIYIPSENVTIAKRAIGYNSSGARDEMVAIIGKKGSTAEAYAAVNNILFHNVDDPLTHNPAKDATCAEEGNYEYWHCDICDMNFNNAEGTDRAYYTVIPKLEHTLNYVYGKEATCTKPGNNAYYHCETCGKNFQYQNSSKEYKDEYIIMPALGHWMDYQEGEPATCESLGKKSYYYCWRCEKYFLDKEGKQEISEADLIIPRKAHELKYIETYPSTCLSIGCKSYYYCNKCGRIFLDKAGKQEVSRSELEIPVSSGHRLKHENGWAATCMNTGIREYYVCLDCGKYFPDKAGTKKIEWNDLVTPMTAHKWSSWKIRPTGTSSPMTYPDGKSYPIENIMYAEKYRNCAGCGTTENKNLTYKIHVNGSYLKLKYGQSSTSLRASGFVNGDYLQNVVSNNKKLVTVSNVKRNGTFKLTAGKVSGTATVTLKMNSGLTAMVRVKVEKPTVKTTAITGLKKSVSVVKGKTVTLKPVLKPSNSQEKLTYSSSDKTIATVSSKGVITGKKPGTAKITVKSGSKTVKVTVTVQKVKTTKITGVPKTKTLNKGKSFTIKATASPKNTDEKITYKSSDSKIVSVTSKGVVKGLKKGSATITVRSGSKKVTCKVTVK